MGRSLVLLMILGLPIRAQEDRTVKEALDRVVKAVGDEKTITGIGAFTLRVKGQVNANGETIDVTGDWSMRGLDRFRWEAQATVKGNSFNSAIVGRGEKFWLTGPDGKGKRLLREVLARHVPRGLFERPKQGFSIPWNRWSSGVQGLELERRWERLALPGFKPGSGRALFPEGRLGNSNLQWYAFATMAALEP